MTDDYRARLEALDVKRQRVHTEADLARATRTAQSTPEAVTEDHLTLIGFWHGERAVTDARARREAALHAAPDPPAVTKSAEPAGQRLDETRTEFLAKHGGQAVSYNFLFDHVLPLLKDMKAHSNTRAEALEQLVKAQDARILELEAQCAATAKVEV